jgi:hypothetical protein
MTVLKYTLIPTEANWTEFYYNGEIAVVGGEVNVADDHPHREEVITALLYHGFERVDEETPVAVEA